MLPAIVGSSSCLRVVLAVKFFFSCGMLWNVQAESGQTAESDAPPNPESGAAHVIRVRRLIWNNGTTMARAKPSITGVVVVTRAAAAKLTSPRGSIPGPPAGCQVKS
jgi:hypothetical protein